jgi:hypothetical protein
MDIIKESTGSIAVLRTDNYVHTLAHFLELFEEAKKDFPELKPEDVEIVHYGGERYAKTFGMEFEIPKGKICPAAYAKIEQVEMTR